MVDLRQAILEALASVIGTYHFPRGGSAKALSILPDPDYGYDYPPSGTRIEGLEVVVLPATDASAVPMLRGKRRWQTSTQIFLKQWDSKNDTVAATELIVPILGNNVKIGPRVLPLDQLGNIESRNITFTV